MAEEERGEKAEGGKCSPESEGRLSVTWSKVNWLELGSEETTGAVWILGGGRGESNAVVLYCGM